MGTVEATVSGAMRTKVRVTRPARTARILATLAAAGGMAGAASWGDGPLAMAVGTVAGLAAGSSLGIGSVLLLIHLPVGRP